MKFPLNILVILFFFATQPETILAQQGDKNSANNESLEDILGGFEDSTEKEPPKSIEEILEQFEKESMADEEPISPADEKKVLDFSGSLSLSSSYNYAHKTSSSAITDHSGLSRLRPKLFIETKFSLPDKWKVLLNGHAFYDLSYGINGRDQYTSHVLEEYEKELELGEAYLQGSLLTKLDLKVGRQIVVWGKSDNIRITDVLNPLDNREPGMVDIEDLRLPVAMTRLDYYFGNWGLSSMVLHEKRFNKNAVYGSDFFPLSAPLPNDKNREGMEFAFALNGIFSGWDISFYFAKIFDDKPHFDSSGKQELLHSNLYMGGFAANIARGNFLYKAEAALFDGLKFSNLPGETKSRYDVLVGVEYQGLTDQVISFEVANRHINNFTSELRSTPDSTKEDEFQTAVRYSGDFMHNTLHVLILNSTFGTDLDGGGFQRFSLEYDLNDSVSITGGLVNYISGNIAFFRNIGNNDRIFIDIKYSF